MEIKTQLDLYTEIYRIIKENKFIEDNINIKWVGVDDVIKYLCDEREWYQNEYNNTDKDDYEMNIQRVHEIRLLTRIINEFNKLKIMKGGKYDS